MKTIVHLFSIGMFLFTASGCHMCQSNCGFSPFDICPVDGYPINATYYDGGCCGVSGCGMDVGCGMDIGCGDCCEIEACTPACAAPKVRRKPCRHKQPLRFDNPFKRSSPTCAAPTHFSSASVESSSYATPAMPSSIPGTLKPSGECEECDSNGQSADVSLNFESVPHPPSTTHSYLPPSTSGNQGYTPPVDSSANAPRESWQPPPQIQQQSYSVPKIPTVRLVPPAVDALPRGESAWQKNMPISGQRDMKAQHPAELLTTQPW